MLRGPKFILTNASRLHAYASIQALQVQSFFVGQLDADSGIQLKPSYNAFINMQNIVNRQIPTEDKQIVFFDDRLENLVAPSRMGWITVWIKPQALEVHKPFYVSFVFSSVHEALSFIIRVQS